MSYCTHLLSGSVCQVQRCYWGFQDNRTRPQGEQAET